MIRGEDPPATRASVTMAATEIEPQKVTDRPATSGPAVASDMVDVAISDRRGVRQRMLLGRVMGLVWIVFLIYPIADLFQRHSSSLHRALMMLGVAVFLALYLSLTVFRRRIDGTASRARWVGTAALYALAVVLAVAGGGSWLTVFFYFEGTIGWLRPRVALRFVALTTATVFVLGLWLHADPVNLSASTLETALIGFLAISMFEMFRTNAALRAAREELARLAVAEERLRFARDLHDLLGHSLSLITLKSELAGQLAAVAPERAAHEMRDVERVAREALREVREAVTGYRQPTLAAELASARAVLAAAAIACDVEETAGTLPAPIDAVLAWAVREGVTNIVRHSRARRARIRITRVAETALAEISDDGRGAGPDTLDGTPGSGLAGLSERVAAQGGSLEAGALPSGGFRVRAFVPLSLER